MRPNEDLFGAIVADRGIRPSIGNDCHWHRQRRTADRWPGHCVDKGIGLPVAYSTADAKCRRLILSPANRTDGRIRTNLQEILGSRLDGLNQPQLTDIELALDGIAFATTEKIDGIDRGDEDRFEANAWRHDGGGVQAGLQRQRPTDHFGVYCKSSARRWPFIK